MAGITIRTETGALDAVLATLGGAARGRAVARAVNLTATSVRANVLREIARQVGLTQRALRRQVWVNRVGVAALARVTSGRQGVLGKGVTAKAEVGAIGRDITLAAFKPRQLRSGGVSFSPGRKARRQRVAGGFIQTMPEDRFAGVFIRATGAPNILAGSAEDVRRRRRVRGHGTDLPIAKVVSPGVSRAMLDATVQREIQREGERTLAKRLEEQIRFELQDAISRGRGEGGLRRRRRGRTRR